MINKNFVSLVIVVGVILNVYYSWRADRREERRDTCTCKNRK